EKPTYWRLTIPATDKTETEELVLSMQGVIVNKDLPPILNIPDGRRQPVLCQTVELLGLDCDKFKTCIDTLRHLHQIFACLVPEGDMEPLTFNQFCGSDMVEFSTRYFTSRRDDPNGTAIPSNQYTDPHGMLSRMSNGKFFHGEDNKVLYYTLKHDNGERKITFSEADPVQFRIGDVVEVQITIATMPF
ncbi:hypothetical protein PILCRDRAFT_74910, partial [Piloderma croceum F 1598]